MKKTGTLLAFITVSCVCLGVYGSMQEGVPEQEIGLSKGSVFDAPAPPLVKENESLPGENAPLPRVNPKGPPRVPHLMGDSAPITREENMCLACHLTTTEVDGGPVPIPESHYIDYRNVPGEKRSSPVGARYYCVSCHVPQTDAMPLVENQFKN